jgi:hypothetical protein
MDEEVFPPIKGAVARAKDKDVLCSSPSPPPPGPVEVPAVNELVHDAGTVCPLCKTHQSLTDYFKCLGGGYNFTHTLKEAKTALVASNRRYAHGPKARAASVRASSEIMPE